MVPWKNCQCFGFCSNSEQKPLAIDGWLVFYVSTAKPSSLVPRTGRCGMERRGSSASTVLGLLAAPKLLLGRLVENPSHPRRTLLVAGRLRRLFPPVELFLSRPDASQQLLSAALWLCRLLRHASLLIAFCESGNLLVDSTGEQWYPSGLPNESAGQGGRSNPSPSVGLAGPGETGFGRFFIALEHAQSCTLPVRLGVVLFTTPTGNGLGRARSQAFRKAGPTRMVIRGPPPL